MGKLIKVMLLIMLFSGVMSMMSSAALAYGDSTIQVCWTNCPGPGSN